MRDVFDVDLAVIGLSTKLLLSFQDQISSVHNIGVIVPA